MWLLLLHLFLVLNFIWRFFGPWLCWQPVKWIEEVQQVGLIASCAVLCLVAQLCPTLCDPMDCSLQGSSVHGIFQARILEWVAVPSFRGSSQPRDQTQVSCIAGGFFTIWATREILSFDSPQTESKSLSISWFLQTESRSTLMNPRSRARRKPRDTQVWLSVLADNRITE